MVDTATLSRLGVEATGDDAADHAAGNKLFVDCAGDTVSS